MIVTHHPFDLPAGYDPEHLVGRSRMAMAQLAEVGADLFLAGHLHVSHVGHTAARYRIAGHSALVDVPMGSGRMVLFGMPPTAPRAIRR